MNSFANNLVHAFRKSRAPISTGFVLLLAAWLVSADFLSEEVAPTAFGHQVTTLFGTLPSLAIASLLFLACGLVGTIAIRTFHLFVEIPIQILYERYGLKTRGHPQLSKRESEIMSTDQARRYWLGLGMLVKCWRYIVWFIHRVLSLFRRMNWAPIEDPREPQRRDPWMRELTKWVNTKIAQDPEYDRFLNRDLNESLRNRINRNPELWHLVLSLRKKLRSDPSAPFSTDQCADIAERLRSTSNEDEYRIGILPSIVLLLVALSSIWSWWLLALAVALAIVYFRTVVKRYSLAEKSLSWLIDAEVNGQLLSNELNQIHLLARMDAATELREYDARRRR